MSKHTAGPWHVVPTPESSNQRFKVFAEIVSVALVYYDKNDEANANLIAAAPELLDAAEDALQMLNAHLPELKGYVVPKLIAAIAKATGEKAWPTPPPPGQAGA